MAIIPEGKYVIPSNIQTLIQIIKNDLNSKLHGTTITRMSKYDYDNLSPKDPNTVYYVTDIPTGKVECYLGDTKVSGEGGGGVGSVPFPGIISGNVLMLDTILTQVGTTTHIRDLTTYNFQNSSYSDSSGSITPGGDDRYPATVDYIPLDGATSIQVTSYDTDGNGLLWCAYLYNSSKSYMSSETSSSSLLTWADNTTTRTITGSPAYIRFYFRNTDRTTLPVANVREAWYPYTTSNIDPI